MRFCASTSRSKLADFSAFVMGSGSSAAGVPWFMTSHPKDATEKLFDVMARCPKVAPVIHPVRAVRLFRGSSPAPSMRQRCTVPI